jgi:acylphosphatase
MSKRVQIKLLPDGSIEALTEGIKGKKCVDYLRIFEELLEAKTVDSHYTAEYYQEEVQEGTEQLLDDKVKGSV